MSRLNYVAASLLMALAWATQTSAQAPPSIDLGLRLSAQDSIAKALTY